MHLHDLKIPLVVLLALVAVLLGVAVLEVDKGRRGDMVSAAHATAVDPLQQAITPPGQLAEASIPAASPDPTPLGSLAAEQATPAASDSEAPASTKSVQKRGGVACTDPHRLVDIGANTVIRAQPGGRSVGTLPAQSIYLGQPMTAWVQAVSRNGRWGRVTLPWSKPVGRTGWVRLSGASRSTRTMLVADLSQRQLTVYRGCSELFSVETAIGRQGSPSPRGRFWVTDRIVVPSAQRASFGSYAFGLSTVQPNLPVGWSGGDQMAVHGTGAPGSIGQAASAGCLRVSETALARLKPLLLGGTPVIITA